MAPSSPASACCATFFLCATTELTRSSISPTRDRLTGPETAASVARMIFNELAAHGVDLIVAETGDGIMGEYGIQTIFADPELKAWGAAFVLCANDPVGVAGGVAHFCTAFGLDVDV